MPWPYFLVFAVLGVSSAVSAVAWRSRLWGFLAIVAFINLVISPPPSAVEAVDWQLGVSTAGAVAALIYLASIWSGAFGRFHIRRLTGRPSAVDRERLFDHAMWQVVTDFNRLINAESAEDQAKALVQDGPTLVMRLQNLPAPTEEWAAVAARRAASMEEWISAARDGRRVSDDTVRNASSIVEAQKELRGRYEAAG